MERVPAANRFYLRAGVHGFHCTLRRYRRAPDDRHIWDWNLLHDDQRRPPRLSHSAGR
jgi:hypothetical protein